MTDDFTGFPQEGLDFLRELGQRDKPWFDANRAVYDQQVVAPTKAFVTAIGEQLADSFAPAINAVPKVNGSIAPIKRVSSPLDGAGPCVDHWQEVHRSLHEAADSVR